MREETARIRRAPIDAGKVAQAVIETYGTSDIVEIINASRGRGGS